MGQRAARRGLKPFLMLIAMTTASAAAHAEQLVMPFSCDARGGEVRLNPSDTRAYQIIGRREHHIFTVCSPIDPTRCRNWMIHRFDVNCGGEKVSWLRVADAARSFAAPRYRRASAFVAEGKMHLTVGPLWFAERSGPLADRVWERRAERYGNGPYGDGPRGPMDEVIDLPPGFAPTFGLPIAFDGGSGPRDSFDAVEGPPPSPDAGEDNARWPDEEAYTSGGDSRGERQFAQGAPGEYYDRESGDGRVAPRASSQPSANSMSAPATKPREKVESPALQKGPTPVRKEERAAEAAPSQKASTAKAEPTKAAEATAEVPRSDPPNPGGAKSEAADVEAHKPAAPQGSGTPVAPTILNAPGAAAVSRAAEATPPASPAVAEKAPSPVPQPTSEDRVASSEATAKSEKTETAIPVIGLPTSSESDQAKLGLAPWHWYVIAGTAALLLGLASLLLTRRNKTFDAAMPRDLSSISLGGVPPGQTSLVPFAEPTPPSPIEASKDTPSVAPRPEVRIPETLTEALEVLGASADADPAVLKKIVSGLRQSWHPDLARSNSDRRYREQRMAQINVAWDIIEANLRPAA